MCRCKTEKKLLIGLKSFWRDVSETGSSLLLYPSLLTIIPLRPMHHPYWVLCSSLNRPGSVIISEPLFLLSIWDAFLPSIPHSKDLFISQVLVIGNSRLLIATSDHKGAKRRQLLLSNFSPLFFPLFFPVVFPAKVTSRGFKGLAPFFKILPFMFLFFPFWEPDLRD